MKDYIRLLSVVVLLASPALARRYKPQPAPTVTITAPKAGATVTSPVQFVASATSAYAIVSMTIYVDGGAAYTTSLSSINTYLAIAPGAHNISVQAANTAGNVGTQALALTVQSGSSPTMYQTAFASDSNWLATTSILPSGAINSTGDQIEPYFSNLAAIGLTRDPSRYAIVENWMKWYIAHLNYGDQWGLNGTIYVYDVDAAGREINTYRADSTDSYAATFLTLAWQAYHTGDPGLQAYIRTQYAQLDTIAQVLVQTQQSDGLTWALPSYQVKYLMDNCEGYRGLRDAAQLFQAAFNDSAKAAAYNQRADLMYNGIMGLWMGSAGWSIYKDNGGNLFAPNLATWYPDATSQVFPVLEGVLPGSDPRSQQVYGAFNKAWPGWPTLSFVVQDPFPWVLVADAAAAMGDNARVATYINTVNSKFVNNNYPSPWDAEEAGFWLRVTSYMYGMPF